MALAVMIITFVLAFVLGYPIALSMLMSSTLYLLIAQLDIALLMDQMIMGLEEKFIFLAVPLFIFSAKVFNSGKITDQIFGFAKAMVGSVKGGLAHVNIVTSIIFAGMSGSEIADVAGPGHMEIEAMKEAGYDGPFSCAVTCASAVIGPIIPPSIPMIVYSMLSDTSVGYLFLGGFIPGFTLGGVLMVLVYILSHFRNYPRGDKFRFGNLMRQFKSSFLGLLAPVILLGGIYGGIFTPTEAAGIVSAYAILLCVMVLRTLGAKELFHVLSETVLVTGYVSFLIAAALIFSYVIAREDVAVKLTRIFMGLGITSSKWTALLWLNVLFLVLGCLINVMTIQLVVIPLVLPIVQEVGIDLVHFGVISTLNLMIGVGSPPYGPALFIASAMSNTPLPAVIKEMIIFIAFEIIALGICTFIPDTVLLVPRLFGYAG